MRSELTKDFEETICRVGKSNESAQGSDRIEDGISLEAGISNFIEGKRLMSRDQSGRSLAKQTLPIQGEINVRKWSLPAQDSAHPQEHRIIHQRMINLNPQVRNS
jgi:hypothetical protein